MSATVTGVLARLDGSESVVERARDAIFEAYRELAVRVARRYEIPGGDRDDATQEALIELWRMADSLLDRDDIRNAEALITYHLKRHLGAKCKAVREAKKNRILLDSVRVFALDRSEVQAVEVVGDPYGIGRDPVEVLIDREHFAEIVGRVPTEMRRSGLVWREVVERRANVVELRHQGWSAPKIARALGWSTPTIHQDIRALGLPGRLPSPNVRADVLRCSACGEWKPDDHFPSNRTQPVRRGRHSHCSPCQTGKKREWRERNPDKARRSDRPAKPRLRAKRTVSNVGGWAGSGCPGGCRKLTPDRRYCADCWREIDTAGTLIRGGLDNQEGGV